MEIVQRLRDSEKRVDYSMKETKLVKQFETDGAKDAEYLCIVGTEALDGQVQLKRNDSRESKIVQVKEILVFLDSKQWMAPPLSP
jgi:histidyl-tRNA synthetase